MPIYKYSKILFGQNILYNNLKEKLMEIEQKYNAEQITYLTHTVDRSFINEHHESMVAFIRYKKKKKIRITV